jgi:amino-acid N-acetyltransferase
MDTMIQYPDEVDVRLILQECRLPVSDITPAHLKDFFACGDETRLFGVIGLEIYGNVALLRSLAVSPSRRGVGVGERLVLQAEKHALAQAVRTIYLLTTTADRFFSRLGYSSVSRDQAPDEIQGTAEFSTLCPSSSAFMAKRLGG